MHPFVRIDKNPHIDENMHENKNPHLDANVQTNIKGSAFIYPQLATDVNTPKHAHTDTKGTHISSRVTLSNSACVDIKESTPLLLLAALMTSSATPAHKYVIQQALRPKSQIPD